MREARACAREILERDLPERWQHTSGVAERADELARTVPPADRAVLVAAAWLHDIGYSPALRITGFHPLDGAVYLRSARWEPRITALVAHHSGARYVPEWRGFGAAMAEFEFEETPLSDALTYADQTVGPSGRRMTVQDRIAETMERHGSDSPNAQLRVDRTPYLLAVKARVEARLAETPAGAARH